MWRSKLVARSRCAARGLLRGRFALQRVLGLLHQGGKGDFVANRDVGKNFPIQTDVRGLEAFDEAAVADAIRAAGGIETHDPKTAEFALLLLAIAVGVLPGVLDGFFRVAE